MKRIFAALCAILIFTTSTISVFAAPEDLEEGDEVVLWENPDSVVSDSDSGNQLSEFTEVEEEEEEPVLMSLDGATVNVSEESVQAIADAVAATSDYTNEYQYVINFHDGSHIILDTNEPNLFGDYNVLVGFQGSSVYVYFDTNVTQKQTSSGIYFYDCSNAKMFVTYKNRTKAFDTVDSLNKSIVSFTDYLWSNYHVYDSSTGNLLFESSYAPPVEFNVSFVTGFDDLIIDSVSHLNFVAPELKYDGYSFVGWYLDEEFTLPFDAASYEFKSDTVLYAKWIQYENNNTNVLLMSLLFAFCIDRSCRLFTVLIGRR